MEPQYLRVNLHDQFHQLSFLFKFWNSYSGWSFGNHQIVHSSLQGPEENNNEQDINLEYGYVVVKW